MLASVQRAYLQNVFPLLTISLTSVMSDNKVDLGSERHLEMTMAHKVVHFDQFNDAHLRNGL